jgi:hypothetical protein
MTMVEKPKTHCPLCGADYDASDLAECTWHEDTDETNNGLPVCVAATMRSAASDASGPKIFRPRNAAIAAAAAWVRRRE